MLQISTAELAAKAEETRGQLRHLDQQVRLCVRVCVCLCDERERDRQRDRQVGSGKHKPYGYISMSGVRQVKGLREVMKRK